jgi:UDP-N-acetylmuramoylalanine--D-glutamate ligase
MATERRTAIIETRSEFEGKHIALIGMARTGLAAAPILRNLGAEVRLTDSSPAERLGDRLEAARLLGVQTLAGASPEEALEGAEIVVPSPGVPQDSEVLRLAVRRGLPILSEIEIAYRICRAPILAVTGTNGKTTTTVLLGEILREAGYKTRVAGNVAADELKQALITAADQAEASDVISAEVSSFQLEWVEQFRPKVGILTNITPDHLNRHRSFAEYAACKARLFAAMRPDDVAVVNALNAPARAIGEGARSQRLWCDRGHGQGENYACIREGQMVVRWQGREHRLGSPQALQIPGTHNLENALAAAGAAIAFGVNPDAVSKALREFRGVPHRMERVAEAGGILYINNSMCTNVDAAVRSLEALGRPAVLIAGGSDKNADYSPLGAVIARHARHLILIGDTADLIETSARGAGFTAISRAESMEEAVSAAIRQAQAGDVVILSPACASFGMFQDFEARGAAFRKVVRRYLGEPE